MCHPGRLGRLGAFGADTESVVESVVSESGMNVTPSTEANAPEVRVGEVIAPAHVGATIEAPSTEASAPSAIVLADAIPVEITGTVTVSSPVKIRRTPRRLD
jgi:hypothetical protein